MSNIHFFPRLTEELVAKSGFRDTEYELSYQSPAGDESCLELSKGRMRVVRDPADIWQLRKDGLILKKNSDHRVSEGA